MIHDIYCDITSYANRSFRHPVPGEKLCRKAGVVVASHSGIFRELVFHSSPRAPLKTPAWEARVVDAKKPLEEVNIAEGWFWFQKEVFWKE